MRTLSILFLALVFAAPASAQAPQTGFEQREGESWTTHAEELAFLAAVAAGSPRVTLGELAQSKEGRPLHLVQVGARDPRLPVAMLVCTQHGNEPSGREACLELLRDLAFTSDPALAALLERTTFLFVPTANPDGREADTRGNSDGVDVNRDHVGLATREARAISGAVLQWAPDVLIDLHEYGPSMPVVYDDTVLWLWPRNLNTDAAVHDLAIALGREYLVPAADEAGFGSDEYGQYEVADNDIVQTAGDADEGIMRNAMGLRHVLGILVETRVDADVRQSPSEAVDQAEVQRRRVASHSAVLQGLLKFMTERGAEAARVTAEAAARKAAEGQARSAPVYFGGADNQEPTPEQVVSPPPCGYRLTGEQFASASPILALQGVRVHDIEGGPFVPMGQVAEPMIPLLLDARGARHAVPASPLDQCPSVPAEPAGPAPPASPPKVSPRSCVKRRTVLLPLPKAKGRVLRTTARANGRRVKIRRGVAVVRIGRRAKVVRVRFTQRVRRDGKVRTRRVTRVLRVCR